MDAARRLWILTFGKYGDDPASVYVFDLPLTEKSRPRYEFVLQGSFAPNQLALDPSGKLWVTAGNAVNEYTGPFNRSGNLSPAMILTDGIANATGLAFDKNGNLYVANATSGTKASIAVFTSPISNKQPYFLGGLRRAGGLIFDAAGNLYASDNSKSLSAIVRYNSNNLKAGAHPNIVNRTRLNEIDEKDFAFTSSGDLYFTNCGAHPSIYWYPTGKRPFTAKLAPSVNYTNRQISSVGCVWGIAIK
jgi:sugar lactone lactonase YvrE